MTKNPEWNAQMLETITNMVNSLNTDVKRELRKVIRNIIVPRFEKRIENIKTVLEDTPFSKELSQEFPITEDNIFTLDSSKGMFWVKKDSEDNKWYIRPYYEQSPEEINLDSTPETPDDLIENIEKIQSSFENYLGMLTVILNEKDSKERKKYMNV